MNYKILALETVNALVTEPVLALGVEGHPDIAIIDIGAPERDWGVDLDAVVSGCLVLGFKKMVLKLEEAEISSSFSVACVVTAWLRLVESDGTLAICGLSDGACKRLQELVEPRQFNLHKDMDSAIGWLVSGFRREVEKNFPRTTRCGECGAAGQVVRRGDHSCPECGMTYLVTERGELLL